MLQGKRIDQGSSARREQSRARSLAAKQASLYTGFRVKLVSWQHIKELIALFHTGWHLGQAKAPSGP